MGIKTNLAHSSHSTWKLLATRASKRALRREQFRCFYISAMNYVKVRRPAQVVSGGRAARENNSFARGARISILEIKSQSADPNASAIRHRRQERKPQVRAGSSAKVNDEKQARSQKVTF